MTEEDTLCVDRISQTTCCIITNFLKVAMTLKNKYGQTEQARSEWHVGSVSRKPDEPELKKTLLNQRNKLKRLELGHKDSKPRGDIIRKLIEDSLVDQTLLRPVTQTPVLEL